MKTCHASNTPKSIRLSCVWILTAFWLLAAGCSPQQSTPLGNAPASTYFPIQIGDEEIHLQLALTPPEQQKGLMFRDSLDEDKGMLFLFDQPDQLSFWMRNTRIPLDIGYFDAQGRLLEIYPLFPYDETSVFSKSHQALIAVETNRGWFERNEIRPGARIDLGALAGAVEARGKQHAFLKD